MAHPRLDASSVRDRYGLHLQVGLALSLALLLAATRLPLPLDRDTASETREQETVDLRRVQPTGQEQAPPAPPKPPVPQVVPDEKIAESSGIEFNASLGPDAASGRSAHLQKRPDCGGAQSLREKTHYPPSALERGLEGRVVVQFLIDEEGEIERPRVVQGGHEVLNRAALRTVRRLECTPGRQRSRPAKVKMTMPVIFALPPRLEPTPQRPSPQGRSLRDH